MSDLRLEDLGITVTIELKGRFQLRYVMREVTWATILASLSIEVIKTANREGLTFCPKCKENALRFTEPDNFCYCVDCKFVGLKTDFIRQMLGVDHYSAKRVLYNLAGFPMPALHPRLPRRQQR